MPSEFTLPLSETTMATEFKVYAPFPRVLAQDDDVDLNPTNWYWLHCLTVPVDQLQEWKISPKPFKWLRFAIGVIVGGEGVLSLHPDSPSAACDYEASFPDHSLDVYYHLLDNEKVRMFPTDPRISRTAITSSDCASGGNNFCEQVEERDGGTCILAGVPAELCDAVHLLAHSKGDPYISMITRRRNHLGQPNIIMDHIDDPRNGLFLNSFTHTVLGIDAAFLKTPNFAMNTDDIDPSMHPQAERYTAQLFRSGRSFLGFADLNTALRIPDSGTDSWPPSVLFDAVYAGTVLHHFGTPDFSDVVESLWRNIYYPDGITTATKGKHQQGINKNRADGLTKRERNEARNNRLEHRTPKPDALDKLLLIPYIGFSPEKLIDAMDRADRKEEAANQAHSKEKVDAWRRSVPSDI